MQKPDCLDDHSRNKKADNIISHIVRGDGGVSNQEDLVRESSSRVGVGLTWETSKAA